MSKIASKSEKYDNLLKVIAFAKENGFPAATAAVWPYDDPEYPYQDLDDAFDTMHDTTKVTIGLYLNTTLHLKAVRFDDDDNEITPNTVYDSEEQMGVDHDV